MMDKLNSSHSLISMLTEQELELVLWAFEQGYARGKNDGLDGVHLASSVLRSHLITDLIQVDCKH